MALWFAVFSAEPLVLHACPMHDGPLAARAAAAAEPHAMAAGMQHRAGQPGAGHSGHAGHHACSCPGACCAAPGVAASADAQALVVAVVRLAPLAARPADLFRYRPSDPEHARPPSIGPPPTLHIG